ncbi:MAG: cyanophycinase [Burkholderiaceae bacterium]
MLALLASLDGVFFAGGDQARHLEALGTAVSGAQGYTVGPEWRLICQRHAQGSLVVAGTSAGNHIQGGGLWHGRPVPMIGGGDSCPALGKGFMPASGATQEAPGTPTLYLHGGLGTFPYGVLDSHFSQRCREGRLVSACLYSLVRYGFGVDENTALLVEQPDAAGQVRMRVMGEHGVWVVDVQACQSTVLPDGGLQASGVCVHHLLAGDEVLIDQRGELHVTLAGVPDATAVDASLVVDGWQAIQAYDSGRFAALAQHLCRVGAGAASGSTAGGDDGRCEAAPPPWGMRLRRRPDTRVAWQGGRAAYTRLALDVWPLQPVTLAP